MILAAALLLQAAALPRPPRIGPDWADDAFNGPAACSRRQMEDGAIVSPYLGDRSCVRFKPARLFSGVWMNAFEGQHFFEGAHSNEERQGRRSDVWFETDEQTQHDEGASCPPQHLCRIVFDGRKAIDMHRPPLQGYGHMSVSGGLVLADRIISLEDLGPLTAVSSGNRR